MTTSRRLRSGWASATLPAMIGSGGLISDGDWVESKDQDPNGSVRLTQLADVGDGQFRDRSHRFLRTDQAERLGCTFLKAGDVMVARMPDPLGRACLYPGGPQAAVTVVDICIIRPGAGAVSTRWLVDFINTPQFRLAVAGEQRGSTRKRISRKSLCGLDLPLPPLGEQIRIADEVDSYLTRLDDIVASLERVQAKLKAYRAAVLKAAVEGRLVPTEAFLARVEKRDYESADVLLSRILKERRRRWEEAELARHRAAGKPPRDDKWKGRYQESAAPDTRELPELPEGWCWTRIETAGHVQLGRQRSPAHHSGTHMRPYLRVANVFEDRIDTSDVMSMNFTPEEFETYRLKYGDILLNEGQSPHLVGRPAMYRNEVPGACFTNSLIRFQASRGVDPRFALVVFLAQLQMRRYMRIAQITTNIAHLGAGRFAEVEFPLPPLPEQSRIADEVERLLTTASAAKAMVTTNLNRVDRLRQSILKWAFEGRLVDQDPNEEPAEKLLARIRAERAAAEPVTRRRGRKTKRSA